MQYFVVHCKDKFWSLKGWTDIHHATKYQLKERAEKTAREIVLDNCHRCLPGRICPVTVQEIVVNYGLKP